ncbi:T9SS type A sorting domain-containing protein [Fulvivirgaceae bacterium BMA10]|uniref:T9SS type A sorting domain-containing protein n=1 Tax=Splendidivirga corallicola TaxID=3051826 RepID=A0ABT8KP49_9BACT|nr:T9SS type A sorting domain-containing protein [Fulvivirgaceae bacterium BMA10]
MAKKIIYLIGIGALCYGCAIQKTQYSKSDFFNQNVEILTNNYQLEYPPGHQLYNNNLVGNSSHIDDRDKVKYLRPISAESFQNNVNQTLWRRFRLIKNENLSTTNASRIQEQHTYDNRTSVKPNPFNGFAVLEFRNEKQQKHILIIYDLAGHVLKRYENITANKVPLERKNLDSGIYFYELKNENSVVANGKIIVD